MSSIFRYSGNKTRLLKYLPPPPSSVKTIVEPFAGSMAYAMFHRPVRIVAAEVNPYVRGLWEWLRTTATVEMLNKIERAKPTEKIDLRLLGLSEPETTLIRLQISGAYVGQLSSFIAYPQHSLKLDKLKEALPYIRQAVAPLAKHYSDVVLRAIPDDAMMFIDPPYLGTSANYKSKGKDHGAINPRALEDFILNGLTFPTLVTYGDGAAETFPRLPWQKVVDRKVPILRGGGTRLRTEYMALLRWPDESRLQCTYPI